MFDDNVFMITGGTGSFGSSVLRKLLATKVREIRVFSRDEKKQEDLRKVLNNQKVKFYIGDVRNYDSLHEAMKGVNYVFHAAALKQVPSCEFYPMEAVLTNVLGTQNVMNAALANGVQKVVALSTDKAVYPINAMGMTKALMEKIIIAKSRLCGIGDTIFCATRYGNIIASRGSVIPLFVSQIRQGMPLTITDPKMTRFMMTLEDSVTLVFYALIHGQQGDIFVQKSPAASVAVIAQALKEFFNADNSICVIGTRHGEKLYESLLSREEMFRAEESERYYRIAADARDLNYNHFSVEGDTPLSIMNDYTSHNTEQLDVNQVKSLLRQCGYVESIFQEIKSKHSYIKDELGVC